MNTQKWARQWRPLVPLTLFFIHSTVNLSRSTFCPCQSWVQSGLWNSPYLIKSQWRSGWSDGPDDTLLGVSRVGDVLDGAVLTHEVGCQIPPGTACLLWFSFFSFSFSPFTLSFSSFVRLVMETQGKEQWLAKEWSEVKPWLNVHGLEENIRNKKRREEKRKAVNRVIQGLCCVKQFTAFVCSCSSSSLSYWLQTALGII